MNCKGLYNFFLLTLLVGFSSCSCSSEEPREAIKPAASSVEAEALVEINRHLVEKEKDIVETMIRSKGWEMNYHAEGYYSMLISGGEGKKIVDNSLVRIACKVQLPDGTVCYDNQIRSFKVNSTVEIAGLHTGLLNRLEGDKLRFIFPPHMAYGLLGDQDKIPPRATLIFEVEVLNVD